MHLVDNIKRIRMFWGSQKEEKKRKKWIGNLFEEIRAESFPNVEKKTDV